MGMTHLMGDPERWRWAALFLVVLVMHLRHALRVGGARRLWHGGHALMAVAMVCMLLPAQVATTSAPLWFIGTGGAAGAALVYALLRHWDGVRVDLPWITLVAGLAATAYMWLMMAGFAVALLTYAAVVWLVCEALGWFTGALSGRPPVPSVPPAGRRAPDRWQVAAGPSTVPPVAGLVTVDPAASRPFLAGERPLAFAATRADRLALGLSALGMAYLLAVMHQVPVHQML